MKFNTFRLLVALGVASAVATGGVLLFRSGARPEHESVAAAATPTANTQALTQPEAPVSHSLPSGAGSKASTNLRPLDARILAQAKQPLSGGKVKDAFPREAWKVSLYADEGTQVNRIKIDLDRDEKWDEKWSFDSAGTVKRQVSPSDDDKAYTEEYFLVNGAWSSSAKPPTSGSASASSAIPAAAAGLALRSMDREILDRVTQNIDGDKAKDAIPGRAWKINLYKDAGESRVNRLKVDLDRDDKWDEKWTFVRDGDRDEVKREIAPNDDENYTKEYRLRAGARVEK